MLSRALLPGGVRSMEVPPWKVVWEDNTRRSPSGPQMLNIETASEVRFCSIVEHLR